MATNNGTAKAWPVIKITGPGPVYKLTNATSGDEINFSLTLLTGEVATLDLRPGYKTFVSSFRGNIINTILTGSNVVSFALYPGDNSISFLAPGCSLSMTWDERHTSLDGGVV